MTNNASISSQSFGTSTNVGEGKFPQKITAQTITDRYFIEASIVNGAAAYDPAQKVVVWYASSAFSITAAAAVTQLKKTARRIDATPSRVSGETVSTRSQCEPLTGPYIYIWTDVPNLATASTLNVNVVEGP